MKNILTLSMIAVATLFVSSVGAQETTKCDKCPASKATSTVAVQDLDIKGDCSGDCEKGCCQECPVTAAMAKLPKMTYRVGTENTCCSESAAKLAKEKKETLHYVVGEKVFEDKSKAYTSLVEQTEEMVNAFVTPSKCEKSGTHTVAGKSCKCEVQAGKNAELVSNAIKNVKMTYAVGEETCSCPTKAGEMAKKAGKEMTYVVAGEKTCCNMTARLKLAKAKYKAAVEAMVASNAKKETTEKAGT